MSVILTTSASACLEESDYWCAIGVSGIALDPTQRVPGLGRNLELAFDEMREEWLSLTRELGREPSAELAHTPTAAANISDMGLMLAWTRIVDKLAAAPSKTLVICDDPWIFRHLAGRRGVRAGRPPILWTAEIRLWIRGISARVATSMRMFLASIRFRAVRLPATGRPWILSYAHPASTISGIDAYFGDLMLRLPDCSRILHVDGPLARARSLLAEGRGFSLHAFGMPFFALFLFTARWSPRIEGPWVWLVRRAAAQEGGTGRAAMIAWQIHCQKRWLSSAKPTVVTWPWENHSWERELVRTCRSLGVRTVGYQHSTVGRREWNHATDSNPDDGTSLPDQILCSGPVWLDRLRKFGHPAEHLAIGGAWRVSLDERPSHTTLGPIFVALPSDPSISAEMITAIRALAREGMRFVIRDHPMMPFPFEEEAGMMRAKGSLGTQKNLAAVLYAGTTVGLEAVIGGLPTIRFLPETTIANDILPDGFDLPVASAADLGNILRQPTAPPHLENGKIFAPVTIGTWKRLLSSANA
jgi:hypothetical protein